MKLYEVTIKPKSAFGTPLKGDTLFGHFCWQAAHDDSLIDGGLENGLAVYDEAPFAVFSSAFPKITSGDNTLYFLPKPEHPSFMAADKNASIKKKMEERKKLKKKKWLSLDNQGLIIKPNGNLFSDEELISEFLKTADSEVLAFAGKNGKKKVFTEYSQSHNSINRLTQTTGQGDFAPYSTDNFFFYPEMKLVVFVLVDEKVISIEQVMTGIDRIGQSGFGRDASTGIGRFEIQEEYEELNPDFKNADACYSLAPCVPAKGEFSRIFFTPFVRYGKHGNMLARSENPFKRPVIMAEQGSVFLPKEKSGMVKSWIGSAVRNVSFLKPETVCQGYSPWLPVKLEASK